MPHFCASNLRDCGTSCVAFLSLFRLVFMNGESCGVVGGWRACFVSCYCCCFFSSFCIDCHIPTGGEEHTTLFLVSSPFSFFLFYVCFTNVFSFSHCVYVVPINTNTNSAMTCKCIVYSALLPDSNVVVGSLCRSFVTRRACISLYYYYCRLEETARTPTTS